MKTILITILLASGLAAYAETPSRLIGTWKSNEALTLKSMESTKGIPEKSREFFRNDFFGKLVVEVKRENFSSYFAGKAVESNTKYEAKKIDDNNFIIKSYDEITQDYTELKITFIEDCYYTLVSKWQFREYFCKQ
ncbi:hypothetical protein [Kangiella shandongensis]|uniref:hypothetical protein n=1 Tax=Kangiella shandongensis TaxID=2763258 RepID=UPI001CBEFCAE|nr:hypothetical protein [Kangiella shandongensis]